MKVAKLVNSGCEQVAVLVHRLLQEAVTAAGFADSVALALCLVRLCWSHSW